MYLYLCRILNQGNNMQIKRTCKECGRLFQSKHSLKCLECLIFSVPLPDEPKIQVEKPERKKNLVSVRISGIPKIAKLGQVGSPRKANTKTTPSIKNGLAIINVQKKEKVRRNTSNRSVARPPLIEKTGKETVICPLCGTEVGAGQMSNHKQNFHGEKKTIPSPEQSRKSNQWVQEVSGGLPSLGKASR
jgi:uncharacterized Zn finger protein (UPF0148 family)